MTGAEARVGDDPDVRTLLDRSPRWYHVIDVAPGVSTPGWTDLRGHADTAGIPADLSGQRALDCGMFDGFWSFTLEQRGAQVVGIDIDVVPPPDVPGIHRERLARESGGVVPGEGFRALKAFFGSSVERVSCSIMEVSPDRIGGPVDFAFVGALLLHLRDPLGGLERVRSCLVPGGRIALFEPIEKGRVGRAKAPRARFMALDGGWTYWYPNTACLVDWLRAAGFTDVVVGASATVEDAHGGSQLVQAVEARNPS